MQSREPEFYQLGKFEEISRDVDGAIKKFLIKERSTADVYLYKFAKINSYGELTYEHYAEYLAMLIGRQLNVPVVDIILDNSAVYSKYMWCEEPLLNFVNYSEELINSFHMSNLATFNIRALLDKQKNKYVDEVIQMLLFDVLIGNADRHPGNFLYSKERGFYPLFDNGSSLCCYVRDSQVGDLLRDTVRFKSQMVTKSKPVLRGGQKLTHKELLGVLKHSSPNQVSAFCDKLKHLDMSSILSHIEDVNQNRLDLLYKFVTERSRWFYE